MNEEKTYLFKEDDLVNSENVYYNNTPENSFYFALRDKYVHENNPYFTAFPSLCKGFETSLYQYLDGSTTTLKNKSKSTTKSVVEYLYQWEKLLKKLSHLESFFDSRYHHCEHLGDELEFFDQGFVRNWYNKSYRAVLVRNRRTNERETYLVDQEVFTLRYVVCCPKVEELKKVKVVSSPEEYAQELMKTLKEVKCEKGVLLLDDFLNDKEFKEAPKAEKEWKLKCFVLDDLEEVCDNLEKFKTETYYLNPYYLLEC
jgi:hypothetical protein